MGVKSQWSKREVLHSLLPENVQVKVKHILKKDQSNAGDTPYKTLKLELLKIFAPKPEAAFEAAMSRKLSNFDSPSALAKAIIDDLCTCDEPLASACCQRTVWGMWSRQLSPEIRNRLAGMAFNSTTYNTIFDLADAMLQTNAPPPQVAALQAGSSLDETQPAIPYAVNAANRGQGARGRGGRGRGGRGRGRGGNNTNQNQATSNQDKNKPKWPTPKHPDGAPANACFNHHTYGRKAFHCTDPLTCGWANIPPHPRPKPVTE